MTTAGKCRGLKLIPTKAHNLIAISDKLSSHCETISLLTQIYLPPFSLSPGQTCFTQTNL